MNLAMCTRGLRVGKNFLSESFVVVVALNQVQNVTAGTVSFCSLAPTQA